jgi:hypothetical protein
MVPTSVVSGHVLWNFTKEFQSGDILLTTFVCYVPRQTGYTPIRLSSYVDAVSRNNYSDVVMSQHFLSINLCVGRKSLAFILRWRTPNHNRKFWSFYGSGRPSVIIIHTQVIIFNDASYKHQQILLFSNLKVTDTFAKYISSQILCESGHWQVYLNCYNNERESHSFVCSSVEPFLHIDRFTKRRKQ